MVVVECKVCGEVVSLDDSGTAYCVNCRQVSYYDNI